MMLKYLLFSLMVIVIITDILICSGCYFASGFRDVERKLVDLNFVFNEPYVLYETVTESPVKTNLFLIVRAKHDRNYAFVLRNDRWFAHQQCQYRVRRFCLKRFMLIGDVFNHDRLKYHSLKDIKKDGFDEIIDLSPLQKGSSDFCGVWITCEEYGINELTSVARDRMMPFVPFELQNNPGRIIGRYSNYDELLSSFCSFSKWRRSIEYVGVNMSLSYDRKSELL